MKKIVYSIVILCLLVSVLLVYAQLPHHNDLNWGASTTTGIQGYKVYRAVCTGTIIGTVCSAAGAFTIVATLGTVTSYSDTSVVAGNKFDYYVTAFCPVGGCSAGVAGESVPSNHWAGTTPSDSPNPASNLTGSAN